MERSKDMKAVLIGILSLMLSTAAMANDFGLVVGVRSNSADTPSSGVTVSAKTGLGVGAMGYFDFAPKWEMRTGFVYNQRNFTLTASGIDIDLNLSYVDIPVTANYKFADYAGVFAGPVLALLVSKDCKVSGGTCTLTSSPDSMSVGLQFGATFKFAPQVGGEFYYQTIPSEFWKSTLQNARTVGASLLITFE